MKKTIITYGTFDLFHVGHVRLFKRLKEMGSELIVGISSDEFNLVKGKKSFFSYEDRAEIVKSCRYVDAVFREDTWEQKINDIKKYKVDVFAMGSDWEGEFDFLSDLCDVCYLERTEDISTTQIKQKLSSTDTVKLDEIESSLNDVLSIVRLLSRKVS